MARKDIRFAQPKAPREQLVLYARSAHEMAPADDPMRAFETDFIEGLAPTEDPLEKVARLRGQIAKLEKQRAKYQKAFETARDRDARAQKHNGKNALLEKHYADFGNLLSQQSATWPAPSPSKSNIMLVCSSNCRRINRHAPARERR